MRKFLCKESGAVLLVNSKEVAKQFARSDAYEELKEVEALKEKAIKDYTKKELVAYLKTLDIEASEDMKKDDLLALIPEE
jgi:crotonobetainyl-CoA:carnitine CoA-transferase CaiB-like acyl-CoA transferase